jgi:hypothetical protein
LTSSDNRKKYSVDNYATLTIQDFYKIRSAFDEGRIKIMRFLALKAREEKYAKTYKEIADNIKESLKADKYSLQAARKHCKILENIGVIYPTRGPSPQPSDWGGEYIKFYFVVENVIEILAILKAAMQGLDQDRAIKIKEKITKEFKKSPSQFFKYGPIFGAKLFDIQEQILDAVRNIAHNYIGAQKDVIKWSSEVEEELIRRYYYIWLYPPSFANMVLGSYRSFVDYMMSGLTIAQNNIDTSIDMSKIYFRLVKDNANELSQMALRASKTFEPVPAPPAPQGSISIKGGVIPLPHEQDYDEYELYALKKLTDELTEIVQIALSGA